MIPRDLNGRGLVPLGLIPLGLALVSAVVVLWFGWDGGDLPEVSRYRDDAYYYFVWAESLASGRGPVVSDGVATSGVHLLWALMLSALAWLGADLVVWAQYLGLLLHGATAWLVARGDRTQVRPGVLSLAHGLLYLGNPFLLREAQNGQETALACMCLVLLWGCRHAGLHRFAAVGAVAVLARSDLIFAVLALGAWRAAVGKGSVGRRLARAAVTSAVAVGPYALANLAIAGSPVQDSAAPIPWLMHANFHASDADAGESLQRLWWLLRPCLLGWPWLLGGVALVSFWVVWVLPVPRRPGLGALRRWGPIVAVGIAVASGLDNAVALWCIAALFVVEPLVRDLSSERGALGALLCGLGLLVVVHFVVRAYPRPYYFAPLAVGGLLALRCLASTAPWGRYAIGIVAVESLLCVLPGAGVRMDWQEEMSMAGRFLDHVVPDGEAVGCFNSGLVTYYRGRGSPGAGPVYNLDGVVDRRAFEALRAGDQRAHWDRLGVRWVVDNPSQFSRDPSLLHASGMWIAPDFDRDADLEEVARFAAPGGNALRPETEEFRLYRRRGVGATPRDVPGFVDLGAAPDGGRYVLWRGPPGAELLVRPAVGDEPAEPVAWAFEGVVQVLKVAPRGGGEYRVLQLVGGAESVLASFSL